MVPVVITMHDRRAMLPRRLAHVVEPGAVTTARSDAAWPVVRVPGRSVTRPAPMVRVPIVAGKPLEVGWLHAAMMRCMLSKIAAVARSMMRETVRPWAAVAMTWAVVARKVVTRTVMSVPLAFVERTVMRARAMKTCTPMVGKAAAAVLSSEVRLAVMAMPRPVRERAGAVAARYGMRHSVPSLRASIADMLLTRPLRSMAPAGMRAALVALTIAGMLAVWRLFATVFTGMFVAVMLARLFALGTLGPVDLRLVGLDLVAITLLFGLLVTVGLLSSVSLLIRPVGREDVGGG